jgi:DNA adenine methylase
LETPENRTTGRLSPFVKWAGGKTQLLETFDQYIPTTFGAYYEPFLGGGAVFLHLASERKISKATLSDLNKDLINCYVVVRDHLEELLQLLAELQKHARDKEYYYQAARRKFNGIKPDAGVEASVEKAALFIYLNKTCYNGLYRVNQKGEFNVPWGRYKNPTIYNELNLRAVHALLKQPSITILCGDYGTATESAVVNDFVYLDPPYQPVSRTANFTSYTRQSFQWNDQERLADTYNKLAARGCLLMLSNSPRVQKLYSNSGYRIERVRATRAISSVGTKRGPVDELLILNY